MSATKDKIITLPNPHLRQRSKKVGLVNDKIQQLINDMTSATLSWEDSRKHEVGVALAAIQIDVGLRVVIVRSSFRDKTNRSFKVFINPEITKYEGRIIKDYEGCLSIKDIYGKVPRHEKVRVKALNAQGRSFRLKAEGFLARVLQHEVDHTKGIVFVDHIKNNKNAFFQLDQKGELKSLNYENDIKDNDKLWS